MRGGLEQFIFAFEHCAFLEQPTAWPRHLSVLDMPPSICGVGSRLPLRKVSIVPQMRWELPEHLPRIRRDGPRGNCGTMRPVFPRQVIRANATTKDARVSGIRGSHITDQIAVTGHLMFEIRNPNNQMRKFADAGGPYGKLPSSFEPDTRFKVEETITFLAEVRPNWKPTSDPASSSAPNPTWYRSEDEATAAI